MRPVVFALLISLLVANHSSAQVYVSPNGPPSRPTGRISGFVVDDTGTPVAQVMVQAMAELQLADGTRVTSSQSGPPTNESGRFTIDGVRTGTFIIAAIPPPARRRFIAPGISVPQNDDPILALTYYPGVINRAQAQPVAVSEGAEQSILIELRRVQPVHVRGTVSSTSGRSTAGMQVMLYQQIGTSGGTRGGSAVREDGSFDIDSVAPGAYTLFARTSMETGAEFAQQDIDVRARDLDGVALTLGSGGTLSGRIVFDGSGPGPAPLGATLMLPPQPGRPSFGRMMGPASIADDWTFHIPGLYGTYRVGLPQILIGQYRPVRYEFDGQSIGPSNATIDVRSGEHQLVIYMAPASRRP